ncbi:hypothetical protein [Jongsikchunia kroppenstedtii]|uniref:hypothetical protein n=1 Tax=Jongsikchunia kroppenstedtii TaxID=1121721 RepID=UPI0012DF5BD8|nr:hypothetical protein [Jongsikchunia kroppenstedtii]
MTEPLIWPRLDRSKAETRLEVLGDDTGPEKDLSTDSYAFSGIGQRAGKTEIQVLRNTVVETAAGFGFKVRHGFQQGTDPGDRARAEFDAAVFRQLPGLMPMNWSEAGSREVWSWCAIALLPDVTHWRWKWVGKSGRWNRERWIGSDLTRHTWGRQWWRAVQLQGAPSAVDQLLESDFNQLTERANTIGTNPLLVSTFVELYLKAVANGTVDRRDLIRDSTQRLLREMAFVDDSIMGGAEMTAWIAQLLEQSTKALGSADEFGNPMV